MPELRELLQEILHMETWKEIDKCFVAFRRRAKFVPKKNVMYHLYRGQEVKLKFCTESFSGGERGRMLCGL